MTKVEMNLAEGKICIERKGEGFVNISLGKNDISLNVSELKQFCALLKAI